ncbi:hypothetical protein BU24DRAFT_433748 [Aaosphaeria arxii CBS 175.79]|uniref:Uncharacterized protein n=1 Tax=Aaosphaeria arxii CBS 175.79 TaxID=1450172 RepID=A0A6A5XMG2_9PLEO|nr:uncharacterized protein BU24DRAFT_433748 [Aaosphaeria arxii CBS 175.79]KAF2014332.1 hypothetical protein BU24DRAFT_433748 [Aaosphaeria arxii CBS 175.79]
MSHDPVQLPTEVESISEKRKRWVKLLHNLEYAQLIDEVLSVELAKYRNSAVVSSTKSPETYRECALILSSASPLFEAAVEGVLPLRFLLDSKLQAQHVTLLERARSQPSIYVHILADKHGTAPSARQYMAVADIASRYVGEANAENNKIAGLIDSTTPAPISSNLMSLGQRKYLVTPSSSRSKARIARINLFSNSIRRRFLSTPLPDRDLPLWPPPSEVGYSINSPSRLSQHRRHQSSNYIMNLTEDICTHLHLTQHELFRTQHFILHSFIIYLIFRPQQVHIAEIFTSGLLQVWIENGGGFNYYPAGRSNSSGDRVTAEEWRNHDAWVRENSDLDGRWEMLRKRVERDVIAVGRELADIWREVMKD